MYEVVSVFVVVSVFFRPCPEARGGVVGGAGQDADDLGVSAQVEFESET